jgi:hypothetical protein
MPGCGLATALSLPIYFVRNIVVLTRSAIPRSLLCTGEAGYGRSRLQEVLKVEC